MAEQEGPCPLALTMGEPAGIGGEIALKAWLDRKKRRLPNFFLLDDPARIDAVARQLGTEVPIAEIDSPRAAVGLFDDALPVLPLHLPQPAVPGQPNADNAEVVLQAIEKAVALALAGQARGIVTNPIHKATLYAAGFRHRGHTDYLAHLCGADRQPVMMLAAPGLRVVPVTVHLALAEALAALTTEAIVATAEVTGRALVRDFALAAPRLRVAGLNPHAGEDGNLGREEIEIIGPAIATLRERGHNVEGPFAADTMFHETARGRYDAALCMYHDQALIPLKTLAFDSGVNVTLGLAITRTSPDHGTALELAGTGRARQESLIQALRLADEIAGRRIAFDSTGHG
jgi:4-hydroxythreonine-4-phosphate dehydrogenase